MSNYPNNFTLPHSLVGMLEPEQVHQMADSGWGFSPDQIWQKLHYAKDGKPETPSFLATIVDQHVERGILTHGAYPGSAAEVEMNSAPAAAPATGRWAKATTALAASFREPDFRVADDAPFEDFFGDAMEQGMAIYLHADGDASLAEQCRNIHDWRIGWSDEDFGRMDELAFTWDDQGQSGRVEEGLRAFDTYLQQRGTGKRLVAIDVSPEVFVSLVVADDHVEALLDGLRDQGLRARRQDAAPAAGPVAADSPLAGVMPRMQHMPLGTPGQVPAMSSMTMNAGETAMPGRIFSHEVGVIFVRNDGIVVTTDHLEAAGATEDELLEIAISNLSAHLEQVNILSMGTTRMITGAGGFEACMALVPSLWNHLASDFPEGLVIAVPSNDVLVVAERGDAAGIAELQRGVSAIREQAPDTLLSESLYERHGDGHWVVHTPATKKRFWNR